jgi:hypothetical protein
MLTTSIICVLTVLALAAMVGLALFPLALLSGIWAHLGAKDDAAKAARAFAAAHSDSELDEA